MATANTRAEAQRELVEECIWLRMAMQNAAPAEDGYVIHRHFVEAQEKFTAALAALDTLERCARETLEEIEKNGEAI
jgi:hypothetical protein